MSKFSIAKRLLLASALGLSFAAPASAQLDSVLNTAKASTAASAASQQDVERLDDEADQMIREYRAVLQQKDNIELFVAQQDIFLQSQNSELSSLNNQLATIETTKQGMIPMMLRMATALEDSVRSDIPFLLDERLARVESVKAVLSDPDISPAEQYRVVLNAFKIEVSYGQGMDSYEGTHPEKPGNVVNFLRFGRVAFVYMSKDETDIARYNLAEKKWEPLSKKQALQLRQAIRIAKGEAAPNIVYAPVLIAQ